MNVKIQTISSDFLLGYAIFSRTFDTWEFPIPAKYRFPLPVIKPYLDAGPALRAVSASQTPELPPAQPSRQPLGVHIGPEVRFVHWGADAPGAAPFFASRRNSGQFLLGLSY